MRLHERGGATASSAALRRRSCWTEEYTNTRAHECPPRAGGPVGRAPGRARPRGLRCFGGPRFVSSYGSSCGLPPRSVYAGTAGAEHLGQKGTGSTNCISACSPTGVLRRRMNVPQHRQWGPIRSRAPSGKNRTRLRTCDGRRGPEQPSHPQRDMLKASSMLRESKPAMRSWTTPPG